MKKRIYLALVVDDFVLDEEVQLYFKSKNIEILSYYSKFGILKLEADYLIEAEKIKYIDSLELEKEFTPI